MKYEKTQSDKDRELHDLKSSPIMRFLKHKEYFKFNIGDVLIKQTKHGYKGEWKTEVIPGVETPKKFVYVFENELGIGYLKQLRVDGGGFTSQLICVANFDPDTTKFALDQDYVDHLLIGDETEGFQYNKEYLEKKSYREEAVKRNSKLLISTRSIKKTFAWFGTLKVGDVFWLGDTFDELVNRKYQVLTVTDNPITMMPSHISDKIICDINHIKSYRTIKVNVIDAASGQYLTTTVFTGDHFLWRKLTDQKPFPLKDEMCGQVK